MEKIDSHPFESQSNKIEINYELILLLRSNRKLTTHHSYTWSTLHLIKAWSEQQQKQKKNTTPQRNE